MNENQKVTERVREIFLVERVYGAKDLWSN